MLGYILSFCLAVILIAVSMLSIQLAALAWVRIFRTAPKVPKAQLSDSELPHVLVQLPVCNEGYLALRVAAAACALDWPPGRLTIQLLGDGTQGNHAARAGWPCRPGAARRRASAAAPWRPQRLQGGQSRFRPVALRCALCRHLRCRFRPC